MATGLTFAIGGDRVEVGLDQKHVVCPRHGEPFRATWPEGWSRFRELVAERALGSPALQAGLSDPRYWRAIDMVWEDLPRRRTPGEIQRLLEDRPACEWVPPGDLVRCYLTAGVGIVRLCQVCRLLRPGTPYSVTEHGQVRRIHHVCFACVCGGGPIR